MEINIIYKILEYIIIATGAIIIYNSLFNKENKKVKKQAYTDPLTGRGNRHLFLDTVDKMIGRKKKFAICFMDLDGFKQVNDTMGHDAGDELLKALSNTFVTKLPNNAESYRLGGDEFAIIIQNINKTEDITKILDNLKNHLKTPYIIQNTAITLEYSLGIAIYPEDADNRKDLINYADDAMYYIKENGKNSYCFHNKSLKAKMDNKTKMERDLKKAYENNEFCVSYQPRISLDNSKQVCLEALLYWNHPVLGKLDAEYFIKQADEMSLTVKLDVFVLKEVFKKIEELRAEGIDNISFAVNISNKHALRNDLVDNLCSILEENDLQKGMLDIELVDSVDFRKVSQYKIMFEKLKARGANIIVNNYEIKYNQLKVFKELKVDKIKLSAKYITEDKGLNFDILKEIILLSQELDLKVIVDEIETKEQYEKLQKLNINEAQGNQIHKKILLENENTLLSNIKEYIDKR